MIEFFFDCSSPWTYLAFHNIQPLAAELGATIRWRPILVGGVFNLMDVIAKKRLKNGRLNPTSPSGGFGNRAEIRNNSRRPLRNIMT